MKRIISLILSVFLTAAFAAVGSSAANDEYKKLNLTFEAVPGESTAEIELDIYASMKSTPNEMIDKTDDIAYGEVKIYKCVKSVPKGDYIQLKSTGEYGAVLDDDAVFEENTKYYVVIDRIVSISDIQIKPESAVDISLNEVSLKDGGGTYASDENGLKIESFIKCEKEVEAETGPDIEEPDAYEDEELVTDPEGEDGYAEPEEEAAEDIIAEDNETQADEELEGENVKSNHTVIFIAVPAAAAAVAAAVIIIVKKKKK